MPLLNEAYWTAAGKSYTSSGSRWLDLAHDEAMGASLAWLLRSLDIERILNVGDPGWGGILENLTGAAVWTVDAHAPGAVLRADPERMASDLTVQRVRPDLVTVLDTLTVYETWPLVLEQARRVAGPQGWLLVADDFQDPTPSWKRNLPHRQAITWRALVGEAARAGWLLEDSRGVDVLHRKWFLATPEWSWPVVGIATLLVDVLSTLIVPANRARHSAWLFRAKWPEQ